MHKKLFLSAALLASALCFSQAQERKAYSHAERQAEEARIANEIKENLDWHNLDPKQLDGVADSERWLTASKNQSILLSRKTRERFGVFESFNDKSQKVIEIRLHKKNVLAYRFLTSDFECEPAISVNKVTAQFVLYEESCTAKKTNGTFGDSEITAYLYHFASQNMYWLGTIDFKDNPAFVLKNKGDKYEYQAQRSNKGRISIKKRTFSILKNAQGEWIVKEPAIDNDESGALNPVEALPKLPLAPKYNLPNVMNWDE